jgi:glycosyltransferase involved in cell wall biosynthesis
MRVLHFTQTLPGGPATYLNELLAFQTEAYEHVALICPSEQRSLIESERIAMIPLRDARRTPGGLLAMLAALSRHLAAERYDIVHLHSSFAGAVGRMLPRPAGARVVYCAHGWAHAMDVRPPRQRLYAALERVLAARADVIINISRSEHRHAAAAGIASSKCRLIYNGVRDAPWRPLERETAAGRLLFVGRHDRQKGLDILMSAMAQLSKRGFDLTTIGAGVIGRRTVAEVPDGVRALGWQACHVVRAEMERCDLVVAPSRWEGFGLVAVEAMRAGRAVVATRVGGLPEVVVDGETGVLCAPGSAGALTDAILRAATTARRMGVAGRARFERLFTAERMFRETHAAYVQ